jgi:CRISPR-associated protein Cas1
MRRLLNTLFVTSEDIYLSLDGENVVANWEKAVVARYPLHTLSAILSFSYLGASPALMGACAQRGISFTFCTPRGKFLARVTGEANGNVLLRRTQYRMADDPLQSCVVARAMIFGKIYNARWSIERTRRDHGLRVDAPHLLQVSNQLKDLLPLIIGETDLDSLRGLEGVGALAYFGVFDQLILGDRSLFRFEARTRRPPADPVNALLSFAYSLLSHDCAWALESVGLDSYVGFLHRDRPGRSSLALDLMEEFRPCIADRFVLTCINNRVFKPSDFINLENGGVYLNDVGRRTFLQRWQERKKDVLTHPFLKEKVPWGLIPYVQALLLSRFLRGDLDAYPPFLWK